MATSCTVDDVMVWSRAKAHEMLHELGVPPCSGRRDRGHHTFCDALSGSIGGTLVSYRVGVPGPKDADGE